MWRLNKNQCFKCLSADRCKCGHWHFLSDFWWWAQTRSRYKLRTLLWPVFWWEGKRRRKNLFGEGFRDA